MKQNYKEAKGINASLLKALSISPRSAKAIIDNEKFESTALTMGSLVDCLLTTPEEFNATYAVFRGTAPTDKMLVFANEYIRLYKEAHARTEGDEFVNSKDLILQARLNVEYDKRLSDEVIITKFDNACSDYVTFVINNDDKIIVDEATYNHAVELNRITRESKYLTHIFDPKEGTFVLFQVPIYIEIDKFTGKALLDCLVVDTINKTIEPIDFKTYEDSFENSYWKYKYYYQEAWYVWILNCITYGYFSKLEMPEELLSINIEEYKIKQFSFIAIDKSMNKPIIIYQSSVNLSVEVFFDGVITKNLSSDSVVIKSIKKLIEEYNWRVSNDDWVNDYDMEIYGVKKIWL